MGVIELVLKLQVQKAKLRVFLKGYGNFKFHGKDIKSFNDDWEFI